MEKQPLHVAMNGSVAPQAASAPIVELSHTHDLFDFEQQVPDLSVPGELGRLETDSPELIVPLTPEQIELNCLEQDAASLRWGILPERFQVKRGGGGNFLPRKDYEKKKAEAAVKASEEVASRIAAIKRSIEAEGWKEGITDYNEQLDTRSAVREREQKKARILLSHGASFINGPRLNREMQPKMEAEIEQMLERDYPMTGPYSSAGSSYEPHPTNRRDRDEARTSELGNLLREFDHQVLLAAANADASKAVEQEEIIPRSFYDFDGLDDDEFYSLDADESEDSPVVDDGVDYDGYDRFFKEVIGQPSNGNVVESVPYNEAQTPEIQQQAENIWNDEPGDGYDDFFAVVGRPKTLPRPKATNGNGVLFDPSQPRPGQIQEIDMGFGSRPSRIKRARDAARRKIDSLRNKMSSASLSTVVSGTSTARSFAENISKRFNSRTHEEQDPTRAHRLKSKHLVLGLGTTALLVAVGFELFSGDSSHRTVSSEFINHLLSRGQHHDLSQSPSLLNLGHTQIVDKVTHISNVHTAASSHHAVETATAPWTVAHADSPLNPNSALIQAAGRFNQMYGTHYTLAAHDGTTMFMNGSRVITPHDQFLMDQILSKLDD